MKALILAAVPLFLAGCVTATTLSDLQRADALCKSNGGIASIDAKLSSTVKVTCKNTAFFQFSSNG